MVLQAAGLCAWMYVDLKYDGKPTIQGGRGGGVPLSNPKPPIQSPLKRIPFLEILEKCSQHSCSIYFIMKNQEHNLHYRKRETLQKDCV